MKNQSSLPSARGGKRINSSWRKDGTDYILDLKSMKKAVVVTYYTPNFPTSFGAYYGIGTRSYFPFTNEQHKKQFNNPQECCEFSETIIRDWVSSLFVVDSDSNSNSNQEKTIEDKNNDKNIPNFNNMESDGMLDNNDW